MTPAIKALQKAKLKHQILSYQHENRQTGYGFEAVEKLGLNPKQVFKTLVICDLQQSHAVAIVPVAQHVDMKKAAKQLGLKKCQMALPEDVSRYTGYVLGGVSPVGQKRRLSTVIDSSAQQFETIYVSAGKRGLELCLSPQDLALAISASFANIAKSE